MPSTRRSALGSRRAAMPLRSFRATGVWADLGEDKVVNPAPGFWLIFVPFGPREPRVHQKSAPETNYKSHSWALCPCCRKIKNVNDKFEAARGLPRCVVRRGLRMASQPSPRPSSPHPSPVWCVSRASNKKRGRDGSCGCGGEGGSSFSCLR